MPYSSGTFTRVSNSFSQPVFGTIISPTDAISLFDDYDDGLTAIGDQFVYATEYGVRGDGGTYTTELQAAIDAAAGRPIILPYGSFSCGALTYITNSLSFTPGLQMFGQGPENTQIIFTGTSSFWLTMDSTLGFQGFSSIGGFKLTANGSGASGISMHLAAYVEIKDMHILVNGTGIYNTAAGDPTSTFQVLVRRVRFDNCAKTANNFAIDVLPSGTAVEISNWRIENCQFEANGVAGGVVTPPTSGAVRWRGLIMEIVNCGFTANNNTALYIAKTGGAQAVMIDSCDFENTTSTVLPHVYCDTGIRMLKAWNIQFLNSDSYKCQGGIWFDTTAGVAANITIDGVTVRVSTGNNPYVVFKQVGTAANWAGDLNRTKNVNYQLYDSTNQSRYSSLWQFDMIAGQCQMLISASQTMKLLPIGGGSTMPLRLSAEQTSEFVACQIPSAGITVAGLGGLTANTRYYFYLNNTAAIYNPLTPAVSLSSGAPVLDATGYYVKTGDTSYLYLGSAVTNGAGNIETTSQVNSFYPLQLPLGQKPGTQTNDDALQGNIGEYMEGNVLAASKVALTSTVAKTVTSITLTPGDWDVRIQGYILPAATTTTTLAIISLSVNTNTLDTASPNFATLATAAATFTPAQEISLGIVSKRVTVAANTTYYYVARSDFAVSTSAAYGAISARRMR